MKNKVFSALIAVPLLLSSTSAFAAEDGFDIQVVDTKSKAYVDTNGKSVSEYTKFNKEGKVIEASYTVEGAASPISTGGDYSAYASSKPYWSANSSVSRQFEKGFPQARIYANGKSASYTSSKQSSYKSIKKIGVKTTLLFGQQVENTGSSTLSNASIANASAKQKNARISTANSYSQSTHTFVQPGYKSWYPTTKKNGY
ncbi:hypothetical protein ACFC4S_34535 [Priestia megaterium]|uniref:hypothetical protein n=1 Tax=Priestia megaterium TaxID=1404 RepID=UPI0035DD1D94